MPILSFVLVLQELQMLSACTNTGWLILLWFLISFYSPVDGLADFDKRFVLGSTATPTSPVYVRLVDGSSCHDGRVEVFAFNTWGTVCNDDWGDFDAAVVCHMLGFSRGGSRGITANNRIGSGMIWLDNVHCSSTENSITDCRANKWGENDCSHLQDAAVVCNHSTLPDGFLLFTDTQNDKIFRMDLNSGSYVEVPVQQSGNAVALDYDSVDQRIYWTDNINKKIFSISIDASSQMTVKALRKDSMANGIAVDPISRLLFYADTSNDRIYLMTLNGTHERIVVKASLDQPRAIELDPVNGMIYWSAWGIQPKIERSNYDGTNRQIIVSSGLGFPNGLALDLQGQKVYWADEKNHNIEGVNTDGTGRHTVYQDPLSHVFGLAYFQNYLYYTDWQQSSVMKVSVSGGASVPVGPPGFGRLNDIHVHKTSVQFNMTNGCASRNGGCHGICIPTANGGNKCI